ncbi:ACT domain-containing protein ACR3 [Hibiscus syriacus]|uniref:ACT domain-containing protein ACR n=1 Tax=Hibiscus syriacus TaxID=106335 RepID=A0A6A2X398_HIBSY|nr:ACT domain-containing protein ACR3 [Hibiscus syriacus]
MFHVTDQQERKITDGRTIDYIEKALGPQGHTAEWMKICPGKRVGVHSVGNHTTIEVVGRGRPGLLSEISAVLIGLQFNVVAAEQLKPILRGCEDDDKVAHTSFSMGFIHIDRRLHQMLFAERDYEEGGVTSEVDYASSFKPKIRVDRCKEKGYSVVSVQCKDRAKLMFDIFCTLTDMQYVVFHANSWSSGPYASQEYLIRHIEGCTLDAEGEKERVVKCLEAAIHRRVSEIGVQRMPGLSLELFVKDNVGLLCEVTRIIRENGLTVRRAGISTVGEQAVNVFYVRDAYGNPVDTKTIEALRREIGQSIMLNVKKDPKHPRSSLVADGPKQVSSLGTYWKWLA